MMFKKLMFLILFVFLVGCAYGKHINRGDELFEQGQYEDALVEYEAAQQVDPESEEAAGKILATKEKLVSAYTNTARTYLAEEAYFEAIDATRAAYEKLPENPIVVKLVDDVRDKVFAKADAYVASNDYATGLSLTDALVKNLPLIRDKAEIKSTTIRNAWIANLVKRGEDAKSKNRKGDAVLLYTKAAQLSGDENHKTIALTWKNEIVSENLYTLALTGSGTGASSVSNMAVSANLSGTSLRIEDASQKPVDPKATIKFRLGSKKYQTDKTSVEKSIRYESGTKQVENPFYKSKQDKVTDEEKRLVQKEKDLTKAESDVSRYETAVAKEGDTPGTSTGAEQSLSRAKSDVESRRRALNSQRDTLLRAKEDLAKTDRTKEEKVYSDHSYTVTTHTLTGSLQLSGLIKFEKENSSLGNLAKTSVSDSTHGSHGPSKLQADPLNLPRKESMTQTLYNANARYIVGISLGQFQIWRGQLFETAKAAATDDARIDAYMIYLITDPSKVNPEVLKELELFRGIPEADSLFLPRK